MSIHPVWRDAQKRLKNHQPREAQDTMFSEVLDRLDNGETLIPAEGFTGVGKSLIVAPMAVTLPTSYRIAYRNDDGSLRERKHWEPEFSTHRVVISAYTKSQQATINTETFPRVEELLTPRGYAVLMGRSNYLCLDRAQIAQIKPVRDRSIPWDEIIENPGIWLIGDGSRTNYPWLTDEQWRQVCSNAEDGCDKECERDAYKGAKVRAGKAKALMVNHALLTLNYVLDGNVFGKLASDTLIVDEAQLLPDALRSAFGVDLSSVRFSQVANALDKADCGWPRKTVDDAQELFLKVLAQYEHDGDAWRGHDHAAVMWKMMYLTYQKVELENWFANREQRSARRRFENLMGSLHQLSDPGSEYASWVTLKPGRPPKIESQPFDISDHALGLFGSADRTIAMSATMEPLAVKLLGIDKIPLTVSPQPFDLADRRLGYVSPLADDGSGAHQWNEGELVDLVRTANCGTLVVASSKSQMERASAVLSFAGYRVGTQRSTAEVPGLILGLKNRYYDVICGVDSFGTGIDIPGDALRLVVILSALNPPAMVEPYLRLTSEKYGRSAAWRNIFGPMAEEKTLQTAGRLIRTPTDYGVVAFLDPRKFQSQKFRNLLSYDGSAITSSLEDVAAHMARFQ